MTRYKPGTEEKGTRKDIQGLRAIAILLVLLAHAKVPFFQGGFIGVDVFFVLSGFLITGLLVRELEKRKGISLVSFYGRRAKRLLPLASLVLVVIGLASFLVFPELRQIEAGKDIVGAAFYFVNWLFAAQNIDYFTASDTALSPVRHYWSLAVEEQFYFVWPAGIIAAAALAKRAKANPRQVALYLLCAVAAISFAYSVYLTIANPQVAYFSTLTRMWELSLGGILVLALPRASKLQGRSSNALILVGALAIILSAIFMSDKTPFPGWWALAPTLGTVAMLVGGAARKAPLLARPLSVAPMQHIGNISYSWYLWHWPFVVFALALWPEIGTLGLLAATAASLVPTEISHFLIEKPVHNSKTLSKNPKKSLAIGLLLSAIAAAAGLLLFAGRAQVESSQSAPGAAIIKGQVPLQNKATSLSPTPIEAKDDKAGAYFDGCFVWGDILESGKCTYGNTSAKKTMVLFGDSRALQFFDALEIIANQKGWRLVILSRGDCSFADVELDPRCNKWRDNSIERIQEERPELVVLGTATKYFYRLGGKESLPALVSGTKRTIREVRSSGAKVLVMRDQSAAPWVQPAECVAENLSKLQECAWKPGELSGHAFDLMAAEEEGVPTINVQPHVCRPNLCPSVIGNVIVYKDGYHYSATFMKTLAPWIQEKIEKHIKL